MLRAKSSIGLATMADGEFSTKSNTGLALNSVKAAFNVYNRASNND